MVSVFFRPWPSVFLSGFLQQTKLPPPWWGREYDERMRCFYLPKMMLMISVTSCMLMNSSTFTLALSKLNGVGFLPST